MIFAQACLLPVVKNSPLYLMSLEGRMYEQSVKALGPHRLGQVQVKPEGRHLKLMSLRCRM